MNPRRTVSLISLGCSKNLVDSEGLVSTLLSRGFRVLADPEQAELVIINTCGFLVASRQESIEVTERALALKEHGVKGVLVAGCMVGNYGEELRAKVPSVDRFVPFSDYARIDQIADEILPSAEPTTFTVDRLGMDASLTPAHYAYLKISEGCNHTCAFCVIPDIRGRMVSRPLMDLVRRAEAQAARGVKELSLIAQDSTSYGADLYGAVRLVPLLQKLDQVEGLEWIRLMYAYPTEVRDDLAQVLATGQRLLPYLDVPVQHAATNVLKRMRRGYGRDDLDRMITSLRTANANMTLRTTVIVGFPGETDADFEELLEFIRTTRFARLGAFRYSREPGSRADALDGHLEQDVIEERYHRLMAAQQEIAFLFAQSRIGAIERVLVDFPSDGTKPARARSVYDAPEVDAHVLLPGVSVSAGQMLDVRITATHDYDVIGEPVGVLPNAGHSV